LEIVSLLFRAIQCLVFLVRWQNFFFPSMTPRTMMKNTSHHHSSSSSFSCCNKATNTTATTAVPSSSSISSSSPVTVQEAGGCSALSTEQPPPQQLPQQLPSTVSFSWKRRYLFAWMAITLLAIDLIRKNNVVRVVQKMVRNDDGDNNSDQDQLVVAIVGGAFAGSLVPTTPSSSRSRSGTAVSVVVATTTTVEESSDATTTTTTSATSSRRPARFPWRNSLEFTLNASESWLMRQAPKKTKKMTTNRDGPTAVPQQGQGQRLPLCERDEIRQGRWVPAWLQDGAPYITNTVHLRCHAKEYYQQVPFPTYQWLPAAVAAVQNTDSRTTTTTTTSSSSRRPTSNNDNDASVVGNKRQSTSTIKTAAGCDWTPWSWPLSCQLLSHATVLIVGDSLSWEQYSSLVQLHPGGTRTIRQGYQHQSRYLQQNIVQTVCGTGTGASNNPTEDPTGGGATGGGGSVRLVYRRDDHLEFLQQAIADDFPTVLILNRGAHYVNDTHHVQQLRHVVLPIVQEWWNTCRTVYGIQCHFFWRTSVPGHPGCALPSSSSASSSSSSYTPRFTSPINNRSTMEALVANVSNYNDHTILYHWYDYQRQNQLALQELESWRRQALSAQTDKGDDDTATVPFDYRIIDAYDINILRPDEHRAHDGDCLHNCYPGKMDIYNQLLLHYLRMDRTRAHITQLQTVAHVLPKSGSSRTSSSMGNGTKAVVETSTPYDRQAWEAVMAKARNKKRPEKQQR
jgi:hypothetical protein